MNHTNKILIIGLMLIVFSSITFAAVNDNIIAYWTFDDADNNGSLVYDMANDQRHNLSVNKDVSGAVGKIGEAWDCDGAVTLNSSTLKNDLNASYGTLSFWTYPNNANNNNYLYGGYNNPTGVNRFNFLDSGGNGFFVGMGNDATVGEPRKLTSNEYTHVVVRWNVTTYDVFYNNTLRDNGSTSAWNLVDWTWQLCAAWNGVSTYDGRVDDMVFYNVTLSNADISLLYNDGQGSTPLSPIPVFRDPTPTDGEINNTIPIIINFTCSNNESYLWLDTNSNPITPILVNTTEALYTINSTAVGTYYYTASCGIDPSNQNTSIRSFIYDSTQPTITLSADTFFNNNLTTQNPYIGSVFYNITLEDNRDLFGFEFIMELDGVNYYNYSNETLNGTSENIFKRFNITTFPRGRYDIQITGTDAHTANKIKDYKVTKTNRKLAFNTDEGNYIEIESEEDAITDSVKSKDRYSVEFEFIEKGTKKRKFHVRSDYKIIYRPESDYKAHFVVKNKEGGNWIDFEGVDETPTIERINDFHYTVEFNNLKDKVKFDSIGGLNYNIVNYTWYKGIAAYNNPPTLSTQEKTFYLNLTKDSSITDLGANFTYNNTIYEPTRIPGSDHYYWSVVVTSPAVTNDVNITWHWNITMTQTDASILTMNISGAQEIRNFYLDDCSGATDIALNISIYEENNLTTLTADVDAIFTYTTDEVNYFNFTLNYTGISNFSVCLFPSDAEVYLDAYIVYTNAVTERYYIVNNTITNETSEYFLYNFINTDDLSELKATAYNYYYLPYQNIVGKLQRYYPGLNEWKTVQIDRADDKGVLVYYVYQNNRDYKIIWEDIGNIIDTTEPFKLVCDSSTECTESWVVQASGDADNYAGMSTLYNYDNDTGIISLTWSDTGNKVTSVNLLVQQQRVNTIIDICDQTIQGSSGTMTCNISAYTGLITVRAIRTASPDDPFFFKHIVKAVGKLSDILANEGLKNEGVALSFLLQLAAAGFGIVSPVLTVIFAIVGAIIIFLMGSFGVIDFVFVVGAVSIGIIVSFLVKK